jgi:hypothetical protein
LFWVDAMPFTVSVRSDWMEFGRRLTNLEQHQLPFATARALTQTAKQAQRDYRSALPGIFDRPTPYTLSGTYVRPAKKTDLRASIELKDEWAVSKGTPAAKYLAPQILGGARRLKRFERRICTALGLPDTYMVPGRGAQLDRYGNMGRGQLVKILSAIGGLSDVGANANGKGRGRRKADVYFVAKSKSDGRPLGIWQVVGPGRVEPVLVFLRRAPNYKPRFRFDEFMTSSFARHFPRLMKASLISALATAKL